MTTTNSDPTPSFEEPQKSSTNKVKRVKQTLC